MEFIMSMSFFRIAVITVVLFVVTTLAACGGGGGSSSGSKPPVKETSPPVTETKPPAPETKPPVEETKPPVTETKPPVEETKPPVDCSDIHPYEKYIAIGDSLTAGLGDDIAADNVTADGCFKSKGYPPVLIDKLNAAKGRRHYVDNQGVNGATSADGVRTVGLLLGGEAMHVLVLYGSNDSGGGSLAVPPQQFKANMQSIINKIHAAGKKAYLAKIPPVLAESANHEKYVDLGIELDKGIRNKTIQQYNKMIDELVHENGINITPPDFYSYFKSRPQLYSDILHFNGKGYQQMAELWLQRLRSL
jgi:lysophospholipase L1-like esterase